MSNDGNYPPIPGGLPAPPALPPIATQEQRDDIKAAIAYYEARGLDWADVVTFLGLKYTGRLEDYMRPCWPGRRVGRPRSIKAD